MSVNQSTEGKTILKAVENNKIISYIYIYIYTFNEGIVPPSLTKYACTVQTLYKNMTQLRKDSEFL